MQEQSEIQCHAAGTIRNLAAEDQHVVCLLLLLLLLLLLFLFFCNISIFTLSSFHLVIFLRL